MGRKAIKIPWPELCDMYRRSTYALGRRGASLATLAKERGDISPMTLHTHFKSRENDLKQDAQDNPISAETLTLEQGQRQAHKNFNRAVKLIGEGYFLLNKKSPVGLEDIFNHVRKGVKDYVDDAIDKVTGAVRSEPPPSLSTRDEEVSRQNLTTPRQMAAPYLPDVRTLTGLDAYALALDTVTDDKIKENDPPRLSEGASMADLLAFGDNPGTSNPLSGASRAELEGHWGNLQLELLLGEARDAENVLVECAIQRWRTDTPPQDYQIERYERQLDALRDVWARIQALKAEQASSQAEQTRPQPDPAPLTGVPGPKTSLHSLSTIGHCRVETEETA